MRKILLSFILMCTFLNSYAQSEFVNGYLINNNKDTINCLIKDLDWKDNPKTFKYQIFEGSTIKMASIKDIQEFKTHNSWKYKRFTVDIDRSVTALSPISKNIEPKFKTETVFLKQIVAGDANLYIYNENSVERYFFNIKEDSVQQLISKKYMVDRNIIKTNKTYKKQLWDNLKCDNIKIGDIKKTKYLEKDLTQIFNKFNNGADPEYKEVVVKKYRKGINFWIKANYNSMSASFQHPTLAFNKVNFGGKQSLSPEIEAEIYLPYNNNSWAIIVTPSFQSYESKREVIITESLTQTSTSLLAIDYNSIVIPLGLRRYFLLNKKSMLFIDASFAFNFDIKSKIYSDRTDILNYDINTKENFVLGIGYNYKEKYRLELTYGLPKDLLNDYPTIKAEYSILSLKVGYRLFGKREKHI